MATVRIVDPPEMLAHSAAQEVALRAGDSIARRGRFDLALAGGRTPKALYLALAEGGAPDYRSRIDWQRVYCYQGDERGVPPSHPDSNYRMQLDALLGHVPIPPAQLVRFTAEAPDSDAV